MPAPRSCAQSCQTWRSAVHELLDFLGDLRAEASRPEADRETSAPTSDLVYALRLFEEASRNDSIAGRQKKFEQLARRVTDTWTHVTACGAGGR